MIKLHPLYLVYSLAVLGLVGTANYQGWGLTSADEVKGVPKSVRDNPGAYRAHYRAVPRYFGGK
jgi:hypothetical protein